MGQRSMYCTQFPTVVDAQKMAAMVCVNARCKTRQEFYDALADMTLTFDDDRFLGQDLQDE